MHDILKSPGITTTLLLMTLSGCSSAPLSPSPPATVAQVDLSRYAGTWYELAKIPNRFQSQCVANATAQYTRRSDGTIGVVNRCEMQSGTIDEVRGVARVVDRQTNARLEVSFFSILGWRPVWGDYWILELGPRYDYVLVGTPDRQYGWLLSRTPALPPATRAAIDARLRELGYDPTRFEASAQRPGYSPSK